jgi:hypothetical protein
LSTDVDTAAEVSKWWLGRGSEAERRLGAGREARIEGGRGCDSKDLRCNFAICALSLSTAASSSALQFSSSSIEHGVHVVCLFGLRPGISKIRTLYGDVVAYLLIRPIVPMYSPAFSLMYLFEKSKLSGWLETRLRGLVNIIFCSTSAISAAINSFSLSVAMRSGS